MGAVVRMTLLALCSLAPFYHGCAQPDQILVIEATTLIDGRTGAATRGVTIVVEDGRIAAIRSAADAAIPANARLIDGSGKWVTPGLVDVHVHSDSENYLRKMLALGITSIHLMPSALPDRPGAIQERSQAAETPSPRIQLSPMFTGGFPDHVWPGEFEFLKPGTEAEARAAVRDLKKRGYLQIKIIQDDSRLWTGADLLSPRLAPPVFEALVDEAHGLGMRVYVHAPQLVDTRAAVLAGVDAFMHGTMDALVEPAQWEKMKAQKTVWTPTFAVVTDFGEYRRYARRILADANLTATLSEDERSLYEANAVAETPIWDERFAASSEGLERYLDFLEKNTRQAQRLGVPIAVGSDGGPGGVGAHLEMEFLQEAGLTPAQVIVAATHGGAVALGVEGDVGSVEPGKRADLVVLKANPVVDIRNARQIEWVIKGGVPFDPIELVGGVRE